MTDLSIVVVTWNTRDLVLECLGSVELATGRGAGVGRFSVETLVVDNGSSDGTAGAVRARFPWAQLVPLARNVGFAAGANAALRRIAGRYVLLLNSDARIGADAIDRCLRYLDDHANVGILGPQLLNPDGSRQNSIHNFPIVATEVVPKGVFQYLFRRRFPSRRWTGRDPVDVEAVVGAALFARAELIRDIGPLPEEYFFFLEETDWCWVARRAGWRVVHLPTAEVFHLSGGSSKRKSPALTRIEYHRSLYRFYGKYRGPGWKAMVLSLRFAKLCFYVLSQAPLALAGGRHRERWRVHAAVFLWHLRGRPDAVGLGQLDAARLVPAGAPRTSPAG